MNEVLTMEEIKARYPSEWVLIADPEVDEYLRVKRGKVAWHSKDRDEIDKKALELRLKHAAFLYLGKAPEDMEFAL